jgi:hypothetical protein
MSGTVEQAKEKGQEMVSQAQHQVQEETQQVKRQAGDRVRRQVDHRSTQLGEQAQTLAGAVRGTAEQLRSEGRDGQASLADQAADRAERVGSYFRESDSYRILGDAEDFARRRPWIVGGGAALLGFVASRFLKASSSRRYEEQRSGGAYRYDEPSYETAYAGVPSSEQLGGAGYETTGAEGGRAVEHEADLGARR